VSNAGAGPTLFVAVAWLLDVTISPVVVETLVVATMRLPGAVPRGTPVTRLKLAEAPEASVAAEHDTVPVPPTGGVLHVQPGAVIDWKVAPAGIGMLSVGAVAVLGPALETTTV
jgi:hypothetical protein